MKNPGKYFEKNGFIFGASSKFSFGKWSHSVFKFMSMEDANKWLNTEEYDFRERELVSLTQAKRMGYKEN